MWRGGCAGGPYGLGTSYNSGDTAQGGECSDEKINLLPSTKDVQQMICIMIVQDMKYISWIMNITGRNVIIFYPSHKFGGRRCSCECHVLTNIRDAKNNCLKNRRVAFEYVFSDGSSKMVNTRWKHVKYFNTKPNFMHKN
jgi:hypothetical protein